MNSPATTLKANSSPRGGYDGPVVAQSKDYLNRWPLAREIYGIATNGPPEWSIRVGIYGEWGTGKSSVLEFIKSIAQKDGHVIINFNPWEHSTKDSLWRAFVLSIFAEPKLKTISGARKARTKGLAAGLLKSAKVIESVTALANETAAKGVGVGLELVKSTFSFSQKDLKSLCDELGENRVIIIIDDLDRTAPELVPEILFALKELMNIPRFSFICAFDPVVVGQVLGKYHPGFGEGLKFLDKIIDYPRWLPPASTEGLIRLAITEAKCMCDYVPDEAIRDAVPLLPANPRAVRQFIRLLALLKPQIERHNADELRWPVILAANVLKVRYPRIAHEVLGTPSFWDSIGVINVAFQGEVELEKLDEAVSEHVQRTAENIGLPLEESDKKGIKKALKEICSHVGLFSGLNTQAVAYQVNIGEAPAAVTCKEFDAFLSQWEISQVTDTVKTWIDGHALRIERTEQDVYRELLDGVTQRYAQVLNQADSAFGDHERLASAERGGSILTLLNSLVFDLGQLAEGTKEIGSRQLEAIVVAFATFAGNSLPIHRQFWPRNEAFILELFKQWSPDIIPLMRVLRPYELRLRHFHGDSAGELWKKLCALALPRFARQIIANFRQEGFILRVIRGGMDYFDARHTVLDAAGPCWGQFRSETFQVLNEAASNQAVQENAYELLHWLVYLRDKGNSPELQLMETLLSDQSLFAGVWGAATARQLSPSAVYELRDIPSIMKQLSVNCIPPLWWQQALDTLTPPTSSVLVTNGATPDAPGSMR